ncbi:PD-(D/E)XK nuclease family protein [Acaryochloris thomasi]|uniref:PD-(D/E)XK nuclease family protein n=1 Tax=Acaryochloris thomasi TaxID=2929456 RepID=UPI001F2D950F|nr:PD-(D/E)XK nuclease family protein [Acaryochloris thomasi]
MAYPISATRLKLYKSCPQSYYFRYERGLKEQSVFGSPALGKAVHAALKDIYEQWNYAYPIPNLEWFSQCWQSHTVDLGKSSKRRLADAAGVLREIRRANADDEKTPWSRAVNQGVFSSWLLRVCHSGPIRSSGLCR